MNRAILLLTVTVALAPLPLRAESIVPTGHAPGAVAPGIDNSPFGVDLAYDLPITLGALAVAFTPRLLGIAPQASPTLLSPSDLLGFDRGVVGNHSALADSLSDGLLIASIALPHLANFADVMIGGRPGALNGAATDSLVLLETLAITTMLTNVVKATVGRARPYAYDPSTPESDRLSTSANESFFSGHTSIAFSMATSYSYLFTLRNPKSPWVIPMWIGAHGLAATTAGLRVAAGKHFLSDVVVGAAVGSLTGFLVPFLHKKVASRAHRNGGIEDLSIAPAMTGKGLGVDVSFKF